jgi:DNA-binding transcriptional MerR regulator
MDNYYVHPKRHQQAGARGESRGNAAAMDTIDEVAGLVSIGQLAKAAGVSSRTIRYYEELGILPEPRRTSGGTRKYPREYCGYIETALALKDLGFRLEEVKPLARLALGRAVGPGQRARAAQLVEDRIQALDKQVAVLRKLRDCVHHPDGPTRSALLDLRTGRDAQPALCS